MPKYTWTRAKTRSEYMSTKCIALQVRKLLKSRLSKSLKVLDLNQHSSDIGLFLWACTKLNPRTTWRLQLKRVIRALPWFKITFKITQFRILRIFITLEILFIFNW